MYCNKNVKYQAIFAWHFFIWNYINYQSKNMAVCLVHLICKCYHGNEKSIDVRNRSKPFCLFPAKDVKVDYFKNVTFVDYYHGKAKYDADLAEIEKNEPNVGFKYWFDAHPLESLREESKDVKVSKSTYEKHNLTYAQEAAQFGRMSIGFTKEAYEAYIKGETAYRQYEAKWAAKYPNITKFVKTYFDTDSDYKKYNLNTFEWHYNDNIYINIRK